MKISLRIQLHLKMGQFAACCTTGDTNEDLLKAELAKIQHDLRPHPIGIKGHLTNLDESGMKTLLDESIFHNATRCSVYTHDQWVNKE